MSFTCLLAHVMEIDMDHMIDRYGSHDPVMEIDMDHMILLRDHMIFIEIII